MSNLTMTYLQRITFAILLNASFGYSIAFYPFRPQDVDLKRLVLEKCTENTSENDNAFVTLKNIFERFLPCVGNIMLGLEDPINHWNMTCEVMNDEVYPICVEPLVQALSNCLNAEEQFFPDYLNSTYFSLITNICVDDFINTIKESFSESCITEKSFFQNVEKNCVRNLTIVKNVQKGQLELTQNQMCTDLTETYHCIKSLIAENCSKRVQNFVDFVFPPFLERCDTNYNNLSVVSI